MRSRSHLVTLAVLVCLAIAVALPASAGAATNGPILFQATTGKLPQIFSHQPRRHGAQAAHPCQGRRRREPGLVAGWVHDRLRRGEGDARRRLHRQPGRDRRGEAVARRLQVPRRPGLLAGRLADLLRRGLRSRPAPGPRDLRGQQGRQRRAPADHRARGQGRLRHGVAVVARRDAHRVHAREGPEGGRDLRRQHRRHRPRADHALQARRGEPRLVARRHQDRVQQLLGSAPRQVGERLHRPSRTGPA